MKPEGKKLLNIVILGVSFMFLFTAFQTCGNIEQTVIKSFNSTEFHGSGYTSMSIIYGVLSAFSLVAPVVVTVIGPQLSMFFSGLMYSCYIAMFIYPYTWSFYAASVLVGLGAAVVLWTAQGNVLTINSTDGTIGRNSGVFWALFQLSVFFGNLYIYCAWHGHVHITDKDRQTVFISLTVISLVGCFLLFLIRKPDPQPAPSEASQALLQSEQSDSLESSTSSPRTALCSQALDAFVKACKIFVTKEMLLLSFSIAYTGLELTFYSGVYGTCIGAMTQFGHDAKSLIGISGICIGVGEILGGGLFGMLNKSSRFGRNPVVLLGLFTHFVAFYLIFLNIASDAPIAPEAGTDLQAYVPPSVPLALFCSFLLGFGDSCFNTQLLSIVGFVFRNNSAPAFAAFRFIQSIMAAVAFFYSNYLLLQWQLLILVVSGFLGSITFFKAELRAQSIRRESDFGTI
uniref:Major facilitator superfamily domain containing 11 n=1 Tax=Tetraodon nigroviridis TaxID=99883 RepID=H3D160_TETNG